MSYFLGAMRKYATFSGRATRSEYWWFTLIYLALSVALILVDAATGHPGGDGVFYTAFGIATLLPSAAVTARRLHDVGRSGWWMLLALSVIGVIPVLIWTALPSQDLDNNFGVKPPAKN